MMAGSHHAEWLGLLDVSGPFLSPPVLDRVFPQGLDAVDADHVAKLVLAYEEWADEQHSVSPDPLVHDAWIRFVLSESLGLTPEVLLEGDGVPASLVFEAPEHDGSVRPGFVVADPGGGDGGPVPRLLVSVWPAGVDLVAPVGDGGWSASPVERMVALCRAEGVGCRLGLVTNGERWALVDAPVGETSGHASWYGNLWGPERLTLRAFRSLLGMRRFFGVAVEDRLEAMLVESTSYQADVTDQLGLQVRRAVEVLVQAIDRADTDTGGALLADVEPSVVYEAALTVMMRLVFLFSAEERGLLLLGVNKMFDQFYAVSTLSAQLREAADEVGEEVLERRQDAWSRLLGTFRAIFAGVHHEDLEIIPYGSSLFDPDRFAFLEGREAGSSWRDSAAVPLPIDNRTVLLLLESLQMLDLGKGRGARRLSFRALDIEQIGHVYETLLDHTALRATEPMVSLQGNQGYEPEIPVGELTSLWSSDDDERDPLVEFLFKKTKKSKSAIAKALAKNPDQVTVARLEVACGGDKTLLAQVLPFHDLIRLDPWGDPVIIHQGAVYVTAGQDRRSTGTHYTPRALTEEIVQYALEPVVYRGPAEGVDRDDWELRTPAELLELKVCDPAMGSGAFLVQVCRYLSERLLEAWDHAEADIGGPVGVEGDPATSGDALPTDPGERLALAKRLVADRCLYGVDINPIAVEMAKLSIWLITLAKDTPFTFVDHALKCGDSLLGISSIRQAAHFAMNADEAAAHDLGTLFADFSLMSSAIVEAAQQRETLAALPDLDIFDIEAKRNMLRRADMAVVDARLVGDAIAALEIARASMANGQYLDARTILADRLRELLQSDSAADRESVRRHIQYLLDTDLPAGKASRRPLHWPIEFPEAFTGASGFDCMVANPPFLGGKRISGASGSAYREYLTREIGRGVRGNADLAAFFFLRLAGLTSDRGAFGAIATNTIGQGDTREVGLEQLLDSGWTIYRAEPAKPWPGGAAVEVSVLWLSRSEFPSAVLAGETVHRIGANLEIPIGDGSGPLRLDENAKLAFQGTIVLGRGYMIDPDVAADLIALDERNREVLKPYINGKDLNSRPDLSPSRWAIDFGDMSEAKASSYPAVWEVAERDIKPERQSKDASKYPAMVEYWWKHIRPRAELYEAIEGQDRALAVAATSSVLAFAFLPTSYLFANTLYIFSLDRWGDFAVLQSICHDQWVRRFTSSMKGDVRYTTSDAFETFPRPEWTPGMEETGEAFYLARQKLMLRESLGLTKVHNRINDPSDHSRGTEQLRELWASMDRAVADAYGWVDLDLDRDFRLVGHQRRWTLSSVTEAEVLTRLLALNHQRA